MGHYSDIRDAEDEARNRWMKKRFEDSLDELYSFRYKAYTRDIEHELNSIEKYYKSKLWDLKDVK